MFTITPGELHALRLRGERVDLVDVRSPVEYREVHADGAQLVPLDELDPEKVMNARDGMTDRPLYLICRSGSRGRQAVERFEAAGFDRIVNIEGGTLAWERAGLPVIRGEAMMSLERQVRVAAGSLVVLGTTLGAFLHPGFLVGSGLVGAGLVYAGVTDTCGMGLALSRMPWNRAGAACDRSVTRSDLG